MLGVTGRELQNCTPGTDLKLPSDSQLLCGKFTVGGLIQVVKSIDQPTPVSYKAY